MVVVVGDILRASRGYLFSHAAAAEETNDKEFKDDVMAVFRGPTVHPVLVPGIPQIAKPS